MKKKLLPFILGCAMVAAMPLGAHANLSTNTTVEYANEIPTSGSTAGGVAADESQNGFTEYNDTQGNEENTLAQVFTNSDNSTRSGLGNTRNAANAMQGLYDVTEKNEQQGYRATAHSLGDDIADNNTAFNEVTNDTAGTTDLETSVPEFDMKIPADTVLPLGATYWRIGNVEINGRYFVRPDKVKVVTSHEDFKDTDYSDGMSSDDKAKHSITFTVADRRYNDTSIEDAARYYFQNGSNKQQHFPKAYQAYTSQNYQDGLVSEINETHQVWVKATNWSGKTPGKYTGKITFEASVVTDDADSMYTAANLYPAEGTETNPNP